jgi:D-alanyl-D-alanine carboxypeptidase
MIRPRKHITVALAVIFVAGVGLVLANLITDNSKDYSSGSNTTKASFDKSQYSLSDPASIWVVVNKSRALSQLDYVPAKLSVPPMALRLAFGNEEMQVSSQMEAALNDLVSGARDDDLELMLVSGYRSNALQATVYSAEVKANGQVEADKESARPGYSEHQTGLAADIEPVNRQCELQVCFADLAEGKWLAANAYKYGFIIRYPKDKSSITGYTYEPWHIRYVGKALAGEMHDKSIDTLEEFFGLPPAPNYAN